MPFLAFLKSPAILGGIVGGIVLLALAVSWRARGLKIDALKAQMALIEFQCDANRQKLEDKIATQNAQIEALGREMARRDRLVAEADDARQRASLAREKAIEDIQKRKPVIPDEVVGMNRELMACRQAIDLLREPEQ